MKAIKSTYHGPTSSRPSRIIASDADGNRVVATVANYDSVELAHVGAVRILARKMGWTGGVASGGYGPDTQYHVWVNEWTIFNI